MAVATRGNLMRWVEAGYGRVVTGDPAAASAFRTYSLVILTFATVSTAERTSAPLD